MSDPNDPGAIKPILFLFVIVVCSLILMEILAGWWNAHFLFQDFLKGR